MKRRKKQAKLKKLWYQKRKENKETRKNINEEKQVSKEAIWKREQRRRQKEKKKKIEKVRNQTKIRVQNFRRKNKENVAQLELHPELLTSFSNRTKKHRAMKKLVNSLPKSPYKRTTVISAYLERKSPTIKALVKAKKLPSPEANEVVEMSESVFKDVKTVVDSIKHKRSDDARATMNVICASVSGTSAEKGKKKNKLAKKLGLPVRRISGGKVVRQRILTSEKSSITLTKRKTRSDKITDEEKETAYNFGPYRSTPDPRVIKMM